MSVTVRRDFDLQEVSDDRVQDFLDVGYHIDGEEPASADPETATDITEEAPVKDAAKEA